MPNGYSAALFGLSLFARVFTPADTGDRPARLAVSDFDKAREIQIAQPDDRLQSLRVISWNIDRGTHLNTIAEELVQDPGDLYLLQEVDWNTQRTHNADVGSELGRRLGMNLSYGIEFEELSQESGGQAFIGQATLTRLPIRRSRVLRFKHQSNFWQPHSWLPSSIPLMQRRLGNRVALVTDLDFAGRTLVVYNVHLESRSMGMIQADQMDEILADLKQYPDDTPVIFGGDLNTKYFPSVFLRKLERAGFQSSMGERIERTHAIAMALDWIFAKGPVKIEGGAVRRNFKGSDHYPIYARLNLK